MGCGRVVRVALPSRAISGGWDVRVSPAGPAAPWAGPSMWGCQQGLPNSETPPPTAPGPQHAILALLGWRSRPARPFWARPPPAFVPLSSRPVPSSSLTLVFGRILLAFSRLVPQSSTCRGTHPATCFILLRFHFALKSSESLSPFGALVSCSVRRDSTMSGSSIKMVCRDLRGGACTQQVLNKAVSLACSPPGLRPLRRKTVDQGAPGLSGH